jgi:SAM-dependent methyltransferase
MLDKAKDVLSHTVPDDKVTLIEQNMQEDARLPDNLDLVVSSQTLRIFNRQDTIFKSIYNSLRAGGNLVIFDWVQASIFTYAAWFAETDEFRDLTLPELISIHRSFSTYAIMDWEYLLKVHNFTVLRSLIIDTVYCCVIAEKPK